MAGRQKYIWKQERKIITMLMKISIFLPGAFVNIFPLGKATGGERYQIAKELGGLTESGLGRIFSSNDKGHHCRDPKYIILNWYT
jgi:hypothetical protein